MSQIIIIWYKVEQVNEDCSFFVKNLNHLEMYCCRKCIVLYDDWELPMCFNINSAWHYVPT